jgi:hypothetical protein
MPARMGKRAYDIMPHPGGELKLREKADRSRSLWVRSSHALPSLFWLELRRALVTPYAGINGNAPSRREDSRADPLVDWRGQVVGCAAVPFVRMYHRPITHTRLDIP